MKKLLGLLALGAFTCVCWSATPVTLVTGGTVTAVSSVASDTLEFSVKTTGGANGDPCTAVDFVLSSMPSSDASSWQRAYATALLAFTTGSQVWITGYSGSACTGAVQIEICA